MSPPPSPSARPQNVVDWLKPHLQWITLPSWLVSCLFHAAALAVWLFLARTPGCQGDYPGEEGTDFSPVGIVVQQSSDVPAETDSPAEQVPREQQQPLSPLLSPNSAPPVVPESPPIEIALPAFQAPPVIGVGGPPVSASTPGELLNPLQPGAPPTVGEIGQRGGGTSLFGIRDTGRRFVYVIDTSSSMDRYGALKVAKIQLMASLENLDESQEFQVLFVNSSGITQLDPSARGKRSFSNMFRGTDDHRLAVRLQMSSISPDSGTEHYKGLAAALALNPDVIFYLTDAGEPGLTSAEREHVRRANRGRARIHCIEFGEGPMPTTSRGTPVPNFLTKLAAEHDGRYTYQNVIDFRRR